MAQKAFLGSVNPAYVDARVAIQLAKIWLEFWLEKRLEIPF